MKTLLTLTTAGLLVATLSGAAYADRVGADWIPAAQVIEKLTAQGYSDFSKIEADDGHWEVKAVREGVRYEVDVDPKTGAVVKSKRDD